MSKPYLNIGYRSISVRIKATLRTGDHRAVCCLKEKRRTEVLYHEDHSA